MKHALPVILILSWLLSVPKMHSQLPSTDLRAFDYSKADSIALNFPKAKYKSSAEIVGPLISGLQTEHERVRVIYRWITDNITYSYSNRTIDPNKVLKKRKAVCIGYAVLFKEMLKNAGITSEIVTGYTKTEIKNIGMKLKKPDHAWNAVKINQEWYLIDVTWAAGHRDAKTKKFNKMHDPVNFLTPAETFVKKHLPVEEKWQLLAEPVKKKDFIRAPLYYSEWLKCDYRDIMPEKGFIKLRMKDSLEIKINSTCELNDIHLMLGDERNIYRPRVEKQGNSYTIKHKFRLSGTYTLIVFANSWSIVAYKIHIKDYANKLIN